MMEVNYAWYYREDRIPAALRQDWEERLEKIEDMIHEASMYLSRQELGVVFRERYNHLDYFEAVYMETRSGLYLADMPITGIEAAYLDYANREKVTMQVVKDFLAKLWAEMVPKILSGEMLLDRNGIEMAASRKIGWDECEKIKRCGKITQSPYTIPGRSQVYGATYSVGDHEVGHDEQFEALAIINREEVWKVLETVDMEWGERCAGLKCDGRLWEPEDWEIGGPYVHGQPGMLLEKED